MTREIIMVIRSEVLLRFVRRYRRLLTQEVQNMINMVSEGKSWSLLYENRMIPAINVKSRLKDSPSIRMVRSISS